MNTVEALSMVFGGGAVGAGLVKIIDRLLAHKLARRDKAADEKQANLEGMKKELADHDGRIRCIEEAAVRGEKADQITFKVLNALLSHAITGNATGEMRRVQKELVDSIIENK